MTVYFVYRSHYEGPTLKHLKRFSDATVLDWFRNRWKGIDDLEAAERWVQREMGCELYGFALLFENVAEDDPPALQTVGQLRDTLQQYLPVEGEILFAPHCIQVLTDDDELELAYYFFDDEFLARHPGRAAYLLHEGWRLPGGAGTGPFRAGVRTKPLQPRGRAEGTTYCVLLEYSDSLNLTDLGGGYHIRGVRLPQFCQYLAATTPTEGWP